MTVPYTSVVRLMPLALLAVLVLPADAIDPCRKTNSCGPGGSRVPGPDPGTLPCTDANACAALWDRYRGSQTPPSESEMMKFLEAIQYVGRFTTEAQLNDPGLRANYDRLLAPVVGADSWYRTTMSQRYGSEATGAGAVEENPEPVKTAEVDLAAIDRLPVEEVTDRISRMLPDMIERPVMRYLENGLRAPDAPRPTAQTPQAPRRTPPADTAPLEEEARQTRRPDVAMRAAARYISVGDLAGALPALEIVGQGLRGDGPAQSLLARARYAAGDAEGAKAAARSALALRPDDPFARSLVGNEAALASAARKIKDLKLGFETKPEEDALPVVLTDLQRQEARGALASLAAGVGPTGTPATQAQSILQLAVAKIKSGELKTGDGALFQISRALMVDPGNLRARVLRAHVSNLPGVANYPAALKDAEEALRLEPRSAAALFEKGYALLKLGRDNEALRAIEDGLMLEPENAMGRLYHAMVLEKRGLIDKAVEEYRRAARLDLALEPVVDEALARIAGAGYGSVRVSGQARPVATRGGLLPRSIPVKPVLWALLLVSALALLLEGGKRVFYKDWKTSYSGQTTLADLPATAKGTLQPGTVLGGSFRIVGELARGGIGIVYKAHDVMLKRDVAIKHLNRQAYESGEVRSRFVKEAQLAARLRHPNLAEIFSVVNDEELYLVFELVEGESLAQSLQKRLCLPLPEVKAIIADVAAALDYAHSQRVIHRDLKPANVMREPSGSCKIMDFGIAHEARTMTGQTQTQAWGTPPYMAPEQIMGRVGRESDFYALAVMTYELLAGQRPFEGDNALEKKLRGEFRPIQRVRAELPDGLHAFFARALDPEPSKRFSSAAELSRALAAVDATPVRA